VIMQLSEADAAHWAQLTVVTGGF